MTTKKSVVAAIAILLMAVVFGTACDPNGGRVSEATPAVSAVRAMMQYVGTPKGGTFQPTNFTADDGTVIEFGTFETDADGNVINADITMTMPNGQTLKFTMAPSTSGTGESVEEAVEYLEDHALSDGWVDVNHRGVTGRVNLRIDEWDDGRPEYEIIGWDVSFTDLRLEDGWAQSVSGSHEFSERGERETSAINVTIGTYAEDGLVLNDIAINGTVIEDETWDDDSFEFDGSISGKFAARSGKETSISFSGLIDAVEDRYLHFPEYELVIDGKNCAIGRESKPFVQ